jgi:hypothetical protein
MDDMLYNFRLTDESAKEMARFNASMDEEKRSRLEMMAAAYPTHKEFSVSMLDFVNKNASEKAVRACAVKSNRRSRTQKRLAECMRNEEMSEQQKYFLINLMYYRHNIHAHIDRLWGDSRETSRMRDFFTVIMTKEGFDALGFPYDGGIRESYIELMGLIDRCGEVGCDNEKYVDKIYNVQETLNDRIEGFLTDIDSRFQMHLAPTGKARENVDCRRRTIEKLLKNIRMEKEMYQQMMEGFVQGGGPSKKKGRETPQPYYGRKPVKRTHKTTHHIRDQGYEHI